MTPPCDVKLSIKRLPGRFPVGGPQDPQLLIFNQDRRYVRLNLNGEMPLILDSQIIHRFEISSRYLLRAVYGLLI